MTYPWRERLRDIRAILKGLRVYPPVSIPSIWEVDPDCSVPMNTWVVGDHVEDARPNRLLQVYWGRKT